ncbi:hypothetical protein NMY22_g697 [Coprinellus aureogranulatus]|nr:hypothetical protein NMY22_g697 [Coprinellus aureogranulatus]
MSWGTLLLGNRLMRRRTCRSSLLEYYSQTFTIPHLAEERGVVLSPLEPVASDFAWILEYDDEQRRKRSAKATPNETIKFSVF